MQQQARLRILICDVDDWPDRALTSQIGHRQANSGSSSSGFTLIDDVALVDTVAKMERYIKDYNVVFVDPFRMGLDQSLESLLSLKHARTDIVFVLYFDFTALAMSKADRAAFFRSHRRQLRHYTWLDKRIPLISFADAVTNTLDICGDRIFKSGQGRATGLGYSRGGAGEPSSSGQPIAQASRRRRQVINDKVFLSYSAEDARHAASLRTALSRDGFRVESASDSYGRVSEWILESIRRCRFFVSLLGAHVKLADQTFLPHPDVLEEKGAAVAYEKEMLVLAKSEVTGAAREGRLAGDRSYITLDEGNIARSALDVVETLRTWRDTRPPPDLPRTNYGSAVEPDTVFVSHRFEDGHLVEMLRRVLSPELKVVVGDKYYGSIGSGVLDDIRRCEYFLSLMTKHKLVHGNTYTSPPWLLEEKGAALAMRKPRVLMVEDVVAQTSGEWGHLQGDWRHIPFSTSRENSGESEFTHAIYEARDELMIQAGAGLSTHR
jgi:hypothetical protein